MTKTPPPAGRRRPSRSAAKRAPRPAAGKAYPDAVKAGALHQLGQGASLAQAHRDTGISKPTLSHWAKAAGITVGNTARTAAATEAHVAELTLDAVSRLERIRDYQLTALETMAYLEATVAVELEVAESIREVSTIGGPIYLPPRGTDGELAGHRLEALKRLVGKRDLVGATGLLVDKLETLAGRATERGELVVRFGIPRPSFYEADRDCIQLPPLEQ